MALANLEQLKISHPKRLKPIIVLGLTIIFAACAQMPTQIPTTQPTSSTTMPAPSGEMPGMTTGAAVPSVKGYAEGQEILFLHTEASDAQVAARLTAMMNSPVLGVPSLVQVPNPLLANVFVFTNGVQGGGPMGFQPDVFDCPPGDGCYTPLRALNFVPWKDEKQARELKSVGEVRAAEVRGEITVSRPRVVINMPFVTWAGGHR